MKKILIIGFGEIGKSISEVYDDFPKKYSVSVIDPNLKLKPDDGLTDFDVIEVAIPYNNSFDFVEVINNYLGKYNSQLVIINSTVQVGTTHQLCLDNPSLNIVHSPVRGVHPNLKEGIKTFVKYIGYNNMFANRLCVSHYHDLNIETDSILYSEHTELLKMMSTTQYGYLITMYAELQKIVESIQESNSNFNIDVDQFQTMLQRWNLTYNKGYIHLDMAHVLRPILYSPPNNKIGGHCVIPNAELLSKMCKSDLIDIILKYK